MGLTLEYGIVVFFLAFHGDKAGSCRYAKIYSGVPQYSLPRLPKIMW
jgi:hypothetical protein